MPPRECFSRDVNLESRYGTCFRVVSYAVGYWPSDASSLSRVITFLRTNRDLLMSMLSLAIYYVVACIFSEPARSTSCNFEVTTVSMAVGSTVSTVNVYMQ